MLAAFTVRVSLNTTEALLEESKNIYFAETELLSGQSIFVHDENAAIANSKLIIMQPEPDIEFKNLYICRSMDFLYFFLNFVVVSRGCVAADKLSEKSRKEQLCAKKHHRKRNVEIRRIGNQMCRNMIAESV